MAYLFLDDSKHHRSGFSLAAFAICDVDPTEEISAIFRKHGFDPSAFEFKSSAPMKGDNDLQALRNSLKSFITRNCKMALCVVDSADDVRRLGPASLALLRNALKHPRLVGRQHEVFFDEGLFKQKSAAEALVAGDAELVGCNFHFEQDSKEIMGIQLADIMAHTCSIMLLEALGDITKKGDRQRTWGQRLRWSRGRARLRDVGRNPLRISQPKQAEPKTRFRPSKRRRLSLGTIH